MSSPQTRHSKGLLRVASVLLHSLLPPNLWTLKTLFSIFHSDQNPSFFPFQCFHITLLFINLSIYLFLRLQFHLHSRKLSSIMDIEQRQAELIDAFVKQASTHNGSALATVILDATSHPSLFAFSEILAVPNVVEVCIVFCFGFWFEAYPRLPYV